MTVYCDNEGCVYYEDEYCVADSLYMDDVGICMTCESKEQEEEE